MIHIELLGGLGNQLFQIFCGIAYSIENKVPFKINSNKYDLVSPLDNSSKRPTYFTNFLKNLSEFTFQEKLSLQIYRDKSAFTFEKIPIISQDFTLHGYFQSYKYFNSHFEDICKLINLYDQQSEICKKNNE